MSCARTSWSWRCRMCTHLPERRRVLPHLRGALRQGGWVAAYNPSILQVSQFADALRAARSFAQIETNEVLLRGWHVHGQAVRPEQQMIGHTGFITVARLIADA